MRFAVMKSGVAQALLALLTTGVPVSAWAIDALPEGNTGIAARYPNDVGIAADAKVVFSDDFETYRTANDLTGRWSEIFHRGNFRIANEESSYFAGSQAVEITIPAGSTEVANELRKVLSPTLDTVFIRAYAKFGENNDVVGSSHNGLHVSASYCCAGVPADGANKFTVSMDAHRLTQAVPNPGRMTVYIYHPEQRSQWGDYWHPDGRIIPFDSVLGDFGPDFIARPDFVPALGRWYSYELMVKANTPGLRDGRIAIWIDGKLIADWQNVRLRDRSTLKMDLVSIDMHANASRSAPLKKYYDNVVVATSYIGPMANGPSARPNPPGGLRVN